MIVHFVPCEMRWMESQESDGRGRVPLMIWIGIIESIVIKE